ncbi:MAG: hypothetical protein MUF25_17665, partial [Pirellulaceae bacterium]|nr:hypothetical protein [Pirellulaceae bacterium]
MHDHRRWPTAPSPLPAGGGGTLPFPNITWFQKRCPERQRLSRSETQRDAALAPAPHQTVMQCAYPAHRPFRRGTGAHAQRRS